MATTTNYGWDTPDDTDLVKDGAAAIRTLGSSIDTTTKNLNPQTTTGALAYRSATANVNTALPIGSAGQVLTVAAGVPSWATPAGGGKVLQVIAAYTSTATTNSTTTYADTTLTATITPSSATSKVLVLISQNGVGRTSTNAYQGCNLRLLVGSTVVETFMRLAGTTDTQVKQNFAVSYAHLHSPATTSATTYKTQFAADQNESQAFVQFTSSVSSIILLEIGA
jgi:hypothetical protein